MLQDFTPVSITRLAFSSSSANLAIIALSPHCEPPAATNAGTLTKQLAVCYASQRELEGRRRAVAFCKALMQTSRQ